MNVVDLILYVLAAVCFLAAALTGRNAYSTTYNPNLMALGLLFWVLVPLINAARSLS